MASESVATKNQAPVDRDGLTFTCRDSGGRLKNWLPGERTDSAIWRDGRARGEARFKEIERLAEVDEFEAYWGILAAITSTDWRPEWGEERGFAERLAAAAVIGMHAVSSGILPAFEKDKAEKSSLDAKLHRALERVAELEGRA